MKIKWLGHSAFRVEAAGEVFLIDPFLTQNPVFDGSVDEVSDGVTAVILTHGHEDHLGDSFDIARAKNVPIIGIYEICAWAQKHGVEKVEQTNIGGTIEIGNVKISFVNAVHSSSVIIDGTPVYLGQPAGVIINDGAKSLYHMGDTDIFSDMALINEIYQPDIGIVPTGDRFTMSSKTASLACDRFFDFEFVIPCHFGTFPVLEPDAEEFARLYGAEKTRLLKPLDEIFV